MKMDFPKNKNKKSKNVCALFFSLACFRYKFVVSCLVYKTNDLSAQLRICLNSYVVYVYERF
jgi:hypothetical protein